MIVNETETKARVRALREAPRSRQVTQTPFTPHLPSLSISARLFCPGNAPIELPAEEARGQGLFLTEYPLVGGSFRNCGLSLFFVSLFLEL